MDRTLLLLRVLTLTAGVLLVTGLFARTALFRRAAASTSEVAWRLVTGVQCVLLLNSGLAELLTVARPWLTPVIRAFSRRFYYAAYLTNGILDALLPAVLLVLSLRAGWGRKGSVLLVLWVASAGLVAIGNGALRDWGALMAATQVISLLGIGGYLAFCALFILKRLPGVDPYLAGLVGVTAIFHLVLPIQEAVFQSIGKDLAARIWHLNQVLQVARLSTQFIIVLACIKSARQELAPLPRTPCADLDLP